jgi:hypothetical protein
MISMGYSPAVVNLDISDVANPKLIGKLQPAVSRGRVAVAPHRAAAVGSQHPVRGLRGERRALQRGAQFRGPRRQQEPGAPAPDVIVPAAGTAEGQALQEFL